MCKNNEQSNIYCIEKLYWQFQNIIFYLNAMNCNFRDTYWKLLCQWSVLNFVVFGENCWTSKMWNIDITWRFINLDLTSSIYFNNPIFVKIILFVLLCRYTYPHFFSIFIYFWWPLTNKFRPFERSRVPDRASHLDLTCLIFI